MFKSVFRVKKEYLFTSNFPSITRFWCQRNPLYALPVSVLSGNRLIRFPTVQNSSSNKTNVLCLWSISICFFFFFFSPSTLPFTIGNILYFVDPESPAPSSLTFQSSFGTSFLRGTQKTDTERRVKEKSKRERDPDRKSQRDISIWPVFYLRVVEGFRIGESRSVCIPYVTNLDLGLKYWDPLC